MSDNFAGFVKATHETLGDFKDVHRRLLLRLESLEVGAYEAVTDVKVSKLRWFRSSGEQPLVTTLGGQRPTVDQISETLELRSTYEHYWRDSKERLLISDKTVYYALTSQFAVEWRFLHRKRSVIHSAIDLLRYAEGKEVFLSEEMMVAYGSVKERVDRAGIL